MNVHIGGILLVLLLRFEAFGSEIPTPIQGVQVRVDVSLEEHQFYRYSCIVKNSPQSEGKIYDFELDITRPLQGLKLPSEGLINGPGFAYNTKEKLDEHLRIFKIDIIPTGVSTPRAWISAINPEGTISWSATGMAYGEVDNSGPNDIRPGLSLEGFELASYGLPGIREYFVEPFMNIRDLPADISPKGFQESKQFTNKIPVFGKTIGPTAPPESFVLLDFLTYLVDLKHQAQTLGWIGGPMFALELDKKLDEIKDKLARNDIESAKDKIDAFIQKIGERYKGASEQGTEKFKEQKKGGTNSEENRFITSEGYALLKFNAEYLKDQLGAPKQREDSDNKRDHQERKKYLYLNGLLSMANC